MRQRFEWIALILLAALIGSGWIYLSRDTGRNSGPTPVNTAPYVGSLAPDFTLQTIDGREITLSDYAAGEGMPVVLNFWATWCPPCRVEMPYFESAGRLYDGQVAVIGLNQAESAAVMEAFVIKNGLTYPMLVDEDMRVNNRYGVINLPTTIFIDRNGVVREVLIGTLNLGVLVDRIQDLLDT